MVSGIVMDKSEAPVLLLVFGIPKPPRSIPDILHTQITQKHVTFSTLCRTTLEESLLDELGRPRRVAVDPAEDDKYKEVR